MKPDVGVHAANLSLVRISAILAETLLQRQSNVGFRRYGRAASDAFDRRQWAGSDVR